ncbi:Protein of unknown function [Bacillus toyonensis]|nr:Protein of unknown function [Bacillus toyonensis]
MTCQKQGLQFNSNGMRNI